MRGWLFAVFLIATLIAVLITAIGLLANWGIWIESERVETGKELPHLNKLVTGVLLAFVGLSIELGRRWFITRRAVEGLPALYLDLLGVAIVLPTTIEEEVDANFTMVSDHFNSSYGDTSEDLKFKIQEDMGQTIARARSMRYGGADIRVISEVLPKNEIAPTTP